jgi:hypothetical protein
MVTKCCYATATLIETSYHSYYRCDVCFRPAILIKNQEKQEKNDG